MSSDVVNKSPRAPILIGLVMLVVGVVVGVGAGRFMGQGAVVAQKGYAANDTVDPSASGKVQRQAPDPFFSDPADPWDPFREMRSLQTEMNEMFRQSIARFHASPLMNPFGDDAGYTLSLDVRELKDRYEVKAFLPDAKGSEANVKLEGNRLEVSVTNRQPGVPASTDSPSIGGEWGRYTQVVELAGKLKSEKMKVQQKDHDLVITIPKA